MIRRDWTEALDVLIESKPCLEHLRHTARVCKALHRTSIALAKKNTLLLAAIRQGMDVSALKSLLQCVYWLGGRAGLMRAMTSQQLGYLYDQAGYTVMHHLIDDMADHAKDNGGNGDSDHADPVHINKFHIPLLAWLCDTLGIRDVLALMRSSSPSVMDLVMGLPSSYIPEILKLLVSRTDATTRADLEEMVRTSVDSCMRRRGGVISIFYTMSDIFEYLPGGLPVIREDDLEGVDVVCKMLEEATEDAEPFFLHFLDAALEATKVLAPDARTRVRIMSRSLKGMLVRLTENPQTDIENRRKCIASVLDMHGPVVASTHPPPHMYNVDLVKLLRSTNIVEQGSAQAQWLFEFAALGLRDNPRQLSEFARYLAEPDAPNASSLPSTFVIAFCEASVTWVSQLVLVLDGYRGSEEGVTRKRYIVRCMQAAVGKLVAHASYAQVSVPVRALSLHHMVKEGCVDLVRLCRLREDDGTSNVVIQAYAVAAVAKLYLA